VYTIGEHRGIQRIDQQEELAALYDAAKNEQEFDILQVA
jgi:hypothetical protein